MAILILLLASGLLVGGISFASRHFEESLTNSQANILQSTLNEAINGELRYTTTIYVDDSENENFCGYFSPNFGKIVVDSGEVFYSDTDGQVTADGNKLISGKAYSHGITADVNVALVKTTTGTKKYANYFSVTVTVKNKKGKTISTESFSVIPISTIELTKQTSTV